MKEIRNLDSTISINDESRHVEGYALVFDTPSNDLGGFTESIEKNALDGVLERSDILCLLNHNEERGILARYNKGVGSLKLEVDERGLKYSFDAPETALGNELLEGLRRGDISASSFAFRIEKDEWKKEDGKFKRKILKFNELYDVSPVYRPAYSETSVQVDKRGMKEIEEREKAELAEYFEKLKSQIKHE